MKMHRSLSAAALCVGIVGLASAQPVPIVPPGTDVFGQPNQGPGRYPNILTGATFFVSLPENTVNALFGSNALFHDRIESGPIRWTAGNTNAGDLDIVIGPAQPDDERSYPTWAGWDAFREIGRPDPGISPNPLPRVLPLPATQWPSQGDWGRLRLRSATQFALPNFSWGTNPAHGVIIATVANLGRDNLNFSGADAITPLGLTFGHAHVTDDGGDSTGRAYNPITGEFRGTGLYVSTFVIGDRPGPQDELVTDVSAAYFPYSQGWIGGFFNGIGDWRVRGGLPAATPGLDASVVQNIGGTDARYRITLPGLTPADGMLLVQNVNSTNETQIAGVLPTDTGWDVAMRFDDEIDPAGTTFFAFADGDARFAFVFVPFCGQNFVGGRVTPAGQLVQGGGLSVVRVGEGRYEITVPGKTDADGALLITGAGSVPSDPTIPDNTFFNYAFTPSDSNPYLFTVQSRVLDAGTNTWGESYPARDSGFYVMWIDFTNPATPNCGVVCPCAADFDGSGGTPDGGDIDAFFNAWLIGDVSSDVDCSGGTPDGGDIDTFFSQWIAGGCD